MNLLRWPSGSNNLPGAGAAELGPVQGVQGEGEAGGGGAGGWRRTNTNRNTNTKIQIQQNHHKHNLGEEEYHQRPLCQERHLPALLPQGP